MSPEQARAVEELATKTLEQIQVETAYTWAYRAWAAKLHASRAPDSKDFLRWMNDSTEYLHEAIEHASLSGSDDVLHEVRRIVADF